MLGKGRAKLGGGGGKEGKIRGILLSGLSLNAASLSVPVWLCYATGAVFPLRLPHGKGAFEADLFCCGALCFSGAKILNSFC